MLRVIRSLRSRWENGVVARHGPPSGHWTRFTAAVPMLAGFDADSLERLRRLVTLFLYRKRIQGVAGQGVTAAMRQAIATQACLPILNLGLDWYRGWVTVLVYPDEFLARHEYVDEDGVAHHVTRPLVGEALHEGPVILSWAHAESDLSDSSEGNVVLHEFAHKLDMLTGDANGMPPLHRGMDPLTWTRAFSHAFDDLNGRIEAGETPPLDPYGADEPGEFFAVMSEAFFLDPACLANEYPAVYQQLAQFFRQDPLARLGLPSGAGPAPGIGR
jgi:Mlc titration factor MtfA (ptsG expression regulator)